MYYRYKVTVYRRHFNTCIWFLLTCRKEPDGKLYVKYQVIGPNHVAVPTHFFKVVAIETMSGEFEVMSFMLPNQAMDENIRLKNFLVPIDSVERAAGFLLFEKLPTKLIKSMNSQRQR